ncbi:MAG: hypothetical protein U0V49_00850 [Saprospiraceae bacterium]
MKYFITFFLVLYCCISASAQNSNTYLIKGKTKYIKKKSTLSSDVLFFTICDDKSLKSNCINYIKSGTNNIEPTGLLESEYKTIIISKNIQKLPNVKFDKIGNNYKIPYIQKNNSIIYFLADGKELQIIEFAPSKNVIFNDNDPAPTTPEPSDLEKCRQDCRDHFDVCMNSHNPHGDDNIFVCAGSYLRCKAICNSILTKSIISINSLKIKTIVKSN